MPTSESSLEPSHHQQPQAKLEEEESRNRSSGPIDGDILVDSQGLNHLSCALRLHTSRDAQPSEDIVENSPDRGVEPQRHPEGLDATVQGNSQDEKGIEPIDMFVPVTASEGGVCDVYFARHGVDGWEITIERRERREEEERITVVVKYPQS